MFMNNLFSKDKINTGRQIELDIAKSFSIIFMIFVHTLSAAMLLENTITMPYSVIVGNILGGGHLVLRYLCSVWELEYYIQGTPNQVQ